MELTGANTYTGDTTISAGTLKLSGGGLLGSGGTYSGTLSIDGTSAFVWDGDILQVLNGTVEGSGTGGILATGTGQLRMVFGNNITYSGPVTVDGGSLQFRNTADLKGFTPNNLNIEGDGALAIQSSVGGNNRTVLNNKTWNFDNGGGTLTFNGGNHLFQGGGSYPQLRCHCRRLGQFDSIDQRWLHEHAEDRVISSLMSLMVPRTGT